MHKQVPIKRILIPIDFTDSARDAFYAGISLASKLEADVYVLYVSEPIRSFDFSKKKYVETAEKIERVEAGVQRRLDELWSEGGLELVDRRRIMLLVEGGKAGPVIIKTANDKKIDMIVLGSSAEGGIGSKLGQTSEWVNREARCSVWTVRSRD